MTVVPSLSEEVSFPKRDFWKAVLAALIVPAVLYLFATLAIGGMAPWKIISEWDIPEARIVSMHWAGYTVLRARSGAQHGARYKQ